MNTKPQIVILWILSHLQEPGVQRSLCDVEHLRTVHTAVIIHLLDDESKGEGWDVQHVEQRGLAGTNFVASLDQTHIALEKQKQKSFSFKCQHFKNVCDCKVDLFQIYYKKNVKQTKISMVPLEILVVIPRAWKKEVFSGPRPVFWAGTVTSQGAMAPARAAAGTWDLTEQTLNYTALKAKS